MANVAGQLGLVYTPSYSGHEAWQAQLEVLRAAVIHLTPKEVIDQLDVSKSTLSQALHEQADKRWAAEWTHIVKAMLAQRYDEVSIDLLRKLCDRDLAVTVYIVEECRELTPAEEAAALRFEMARLEGGRAALARVAAKGKRK